MLKQIGFELFKMSRRPRTYLGYSAFLLINTCVMLGLKYGDLADEFGGRRAGSSGFGVVGTPLNAEFMTWIVTGSPLAAMILVMFMPFFVCLVFGEIFGGEVSDGTLRTALARSVSRVSFFAAKFAASLIYAASLVFFLGASAYLIGLAFFGHGGLLATGTFEHPMIAWYPGGTALWRLALSLMLICAGATTVGMVAFFISSWLNNSLGAIGGAIMLLFAMAIVGEIPYFRPIKDYLFSTHLLIGNNAFIDPIPWDNIWIALRCFAAYSIGLFLISLMIFRRKDILA